MLDGVGKKTGNCFIDRCLMIKTNDIESIRCIITKEVTEKYIKLHDMISPIMIVFGKGADLLPNVDFFKGKTVMGIQTTNWIEPEKFMSAYEASIDLLGGM